MSIKDAASQYLVYRTLKYYDVNGENEQWDECVHEYSNKQYFPSTVMTEITSVT